MNAIGRDSLPRGLLLVLAGWTAAAALLRPFDNAPFVDDWVYAWSVEHLLATGRLEVLDLSSNMIQTQVLWGALFCLPFGFSFTALRVSTWVLAAVALVGVHRLLRETGATESGAALGAAAVAAYPPFGVLSFSFMTEVPLLAALVWTLVGFVRAYARASVRDLWLGTILAGLAGGIRVVGIVPALAMSAALLLDRRGWGRARGRFLAPLAAVLFVAVLLAYHRAHVRHVADLSDLVNTPQPRLEALREYAIPLLPAWLPLSLEFAAVVLGLALAPVAAGLVPSARSFSRVLAIAAGAAMIVAAGHLTGGLHYPAFASEGTWASEELGATLTLLPGWIPWRLPLPWTLAATLACWASVVWLAASAAAPDRRRASSPVLWWTLIGLILMTAVLWLATDRYILPFLPPALALVLGQGARVSWRPAAVVLTVFALVGTIAMRDRLQVERAVWTAVADLRQRGVDPAAIDAGYVVNGWLQYAHPSFAHRDPDGTVNVPFVNGDAELPWIVGAGPVADATIVGRYPFARTFRSDGAILVQRRDGRSSGP